MESLDKNEKERLIIHLKSHEIDCNPILLKYEIKYLIELLEKEK